MGWSLTSSIFVEGMLVDLSGLSREALVLGYAGPGAVLGRVQRSVRAVRCGPERGRV